MSRAYRIRVRECTSRVVTAEDRVSTRLGILEILPPQDTGALLAHELEKRGFRREGGLMVRTEEALTIAVEVESGTVTVLARGAGEVVLEAEREGRAFDDYGPDATKVRQQLQEQAKKELEKQAERETARLQGEITTRLEERLGELRHELDEVVNRVTAEALKRKAAQLGEIKELTEDPETGSLTIVVEVCDLMSVLIDEDELPLELTTEQAIDAAYASELAEVESKLRRGIACLLECDKDLAPFLYARLRDRMKKQPGRAGFTFLVCSGVDTGGQGQDAQPGAMSPGLIGTMIRQLRDFVTRAVEQKVIVLPHLDLLTTSQGGLTAEAKEVIPLLYQNPDNVLLGLKDPSFAVPRVIENLFPHRVSLVGIARTRLRHLITQKESRRFGRQFNPWQLYKYVSGVNAVRLRKVLSTLEGEDYPADPRNAYRQIRQATLTGTLEVPSVEMDRDVGGYDKVKRQLRQEILHVLARRDQLTEPEDIARLEELIPRGMILWGPPGTGKTFLAKAMATALGAAITIVSGPELKSKWVGESEENLRRIFHQARQSAPSIIVFDELDSFASARGTYQGSGVEHSMVNQLLTEMDGFHKEEMVFVVGTTNLVEMLDPALLRPGRFEFHLHIPYPDDDDRREILRICDLKMRLSMTGEALEYAVRRTSESFLTPAGTPYSGDHLNGLCRAVARIRLREGRTDATTPDDVERGLTEYDERIEVSDEDAVLVATHEAGHFLCSLCCPHHRPPERITIQSKIPWVPFYTEFQKEGTRRVGHSRGELLDMMCVLYGGIEAERLLRGEVSTGAGGYGDPRSDLSRATQLAHLMVEVLGMGGQTTGLRFFRDGKGERQVLSGVQAEAIDRQVNTLIAEAQQRAASILGEHKEDLVRLRDELIAKKTIEGDRVRAIIEEFRRRHPLPNATAKNDHGNGDGGGRKRARAAEK